MTPSAYPRISHLFSGRGTDDDRVLSAPDAAALLADKVTVEEKLDGANVMMWLEDGRVQSALRSGPGSADRAGQLGPLKAWLGQHSDSLRTLLQSLEGGAVYGEWLYLTHTVAYDRLPSYLVVLDVTRPDGSFHSLDERNALAEHHGLTTPPELFRGGPHTLSAVEGLLGASRYGEVAMEGLVVRRLGSGQPRLAKLLYPGLRRLSDDDWGRGRPRNQLADREASWR